MKKSDFKNAMIRGLGRCVIELNSHDNIEKYRDIILWGCLRNIAYDAQSEGTRAEYLYVLQSKFQDNYFENIIIEAYNKSYSDSWLFDQHCELLYLFALDGSMAAKHALNAKFEYLLDQLVNVPSRKRYRPDREQFEWLCASAWYHHLYEYDERCEYNDPEWHQPASVHRSERTNSRMLSA